MTKVQPVRPVVLLPARSGTRDDPDMGDGLPIQMMNQAYISALQTAGLNPMVVPLDTRFPADFTWADGLVLPGGADVQPSRYGATNDPTSEWDEHLDELEFQLLDWALAAKVPILGICRGLQVLNVALGGSLWQDLDTQRPSDVRHPRHGPRDRLVHRLIVSPASQLHGLVRETEFMVNSLHHQGIDRLGRGLRVSARSDDGLVEGIESISAQFLVAVQFHPEELAGNHEFAYRIFSGFAEECASFHAQRSRSLVGATLSG